MTRVSTPDEAAQRRLLLALLAALERPHLANELPQDGAADAELLLEVARRHRLTPLLSAICADRLAGSIAEACRRDRLMTAARNLVLGQATEECLRAFAVADVPVMVLKGVAYESLYGVAGARPTADVDLLVPNDRRRAAFGVLDRLGFEPRSAAPGFDDVDYHEVAWNRRGIEVDLHMALAPRVRCRIDYADVWAHAGSTTVGHTEAHVLASSHAAVFHTLHMAIDHFDVPALYLLDLARLLPSAAAIEAAAETARAWGCRRPFATALALAETFLPAWRSGHASPSPGRVAAGIASRYGSVVPLARSAQLVRKLLHFDDPFTAMRYFAVQTGRNVREMFERRVRQRSARERLALDPK